MVLLAVPPNAREGTVLLAVPNAGARPALLAMAPPKVTPKVNAREGPVLPLVLPNAGAGTEPNAGRGPVMLLTPLG